MRDRSKWSESISVGFQVFAQGGDEEFGAIRDVCPGGRDEFLVNIENGGATALHWRSKRVSTLSRPVS